MKQTTIDDTSLLSQKLAYLWSINTEDQFEDAIKAHGGLKTIIKVIPIEAEGDYAEFTRWRKSYSETLKWKADTEINRHLITSFLPPDAISSWLECMKIDRTGLTVFPTRITATTATLEIMWRGGPARWYLARLKRPQVTGGTLLGTLDLPRFVTSDYSWKPTYRRSQTDPLVFRMEYGTKSYSFTIPKEPHVTYRKSCKISLQGVLAGADKQQDFVGVSGNYPGIALWAVGCSGFAPGVGVSASMKIDFEQSPSGAGVSVAPYIITDGQLGAKGQTMQFLRPGPSGMLSSTAQGGSSSNGTVTIGIYVGRPAMDKDSWTLSARPGSYILITQP